MNYLTINSAQKETYISMANKMFEPYLHNTSIISFITMTLKPKLFKYQCITQYELTIHDVIKILDQCTLRYMLAVELTSKGNIHYHAIIVNATKYGKVSLINRLKKSRTLGFSHVSNEIECAEGLKRAITYLLKDMDTTARILWTREYRPDIIKFSTLYF